jgi:crossover junction endodeoxyribonuclease RusA
MMLPWMPKELSPNARVHWAKKAKAAKSYRADCHVVAKSAGVKMPDGPALLCLTFHPPDKRARDDDNLIASFKAGRDGIADALGIDDVRFALYVQIGEPVKHGAVRAEIRAMEPSAGPDRFWRQL